MITVTVPMCPARELFPNRQGKNLHWATRSKHRKISREAASKAASLLHIKKTITKPVNLTIHARYGSRRRLPDLDATISAAKPMIDGLVEAGLGMVGPQKVRIVANPGKGKTGDPSRGNGESRAPTEEME